MNINVSDIQQARIRRDSFLNMNYKPLMITAESNDDLYYIYMIESKTNPQFRYIGKTKNIYDRALNYIRTYDRMKKNPHWIRPISQAIYQNGIDDFIMYPIATVNGKENTGILEQLLIKKLHTHIDEDGLNVDTHIDVSGGTPHCGYVHSVDTKIKKSKPMMAINDKSKTILIAVGGKILGDYLNTSKDMIKNVIRRPCHLRDWYIYYLNDADRDDITAKYKSKRVCNINGILRYRTEDDDYLQGADLVERFADSPSPYIFSEDPKYSEYKIIFVNYNREYDNSPFSDSYKLCPLEEFLDMLD